MQIPAGSKAYPNPFTIFPSNAYTEPKEGKRICPLEFAWGGAGGTVQEVNLSGGQYASFSQIIMLDVDNSQCGVDTTFYFLDTTDTLVVPAYESGLFPVFTNTTKFFAAAPLALSTDITRVRLLNYLEYPVSNPKSEFASVLTPSNGYLLTGASVNPIVPAGTNGTVFGWSINISNYVTGAGSNVLTLILADGNANSIWRGNLVQSGATPATYPAFCISAMMGVNARFANGLNFTLTQSGTAFASGFVNPNIYYRTP